MINTIVGKAAPIWIISPKFIFSFYFYLKTGNHDFELPFAMWYVIKTTKAPWRIILSCIRFIQRFPFDINNPVGYFAAFTLQYIVFACMFINIGCFASTGIAAYMFAIAFTKGIRNTSIPFNDIAKTRHRQGKIEKQLSVFIVEYSQGKKLRSYINIHFTYLFN